MNLTNAKLLDEKVVAISAKCHTRTVTKEDLLTDWREVTLEELAYTMFGNNLPSISSYASFPHQNYRGDIVGGFAFSGMHYMIYPDGTGVAIHRCWKYHFSKMESDPAGKIRKKPKGKENAMTIRFYAFGCKHKYRDMTALERHERNISLGLCQHAQICEKCQHAHCFDSSD